MKKACSVCLSNCLRLHGAQGENEDSAACLLCASRKREEDEHQNQQRIHAERNPSFLKKMATSTMNTLRLPMSFVRDQIDRLDGSILLEGPSGGKWRVNLQGSFESFSLNFGQGWEKFVADHVLQVDDLLTFSLSAKSHFQVEVYDGAGCLKPSALDAKVPEMEVAEAARPVAETALAARPVARIAGAEVEPARSVAGNAKVEVAEPARPVVGIAEAEVAEPARSVAGIAEAEVAEPARPVAGIAEAEVAEPARSVVEIAERSDPDSGDGLIKLVKSDQELLPEQHIVRGIVVSRRSPVTQLEKDRALQAAKSLELANPNVLLVMSRQNVYKGFWLGIPKQFAKEWMPSENNEVEIVNKGGHSWPAKWIVGRGGLSSGWRRFSLDHRLEEHDVCVLEMIDKVNYVLLVHIFRVLKSPGEDPGLYPRTISPDRRNSRKSFNCHEADGTLGEGSQRKSSRRAGHNGTHTLEPDSATKSLEHRSEHLLTGCSGPGEQDESRAAKDTPAAPQQSSRHRSGLLGDDMAAPGDVATRGSGADEQGETRVVKGTPTAKQAVLTPISSGQDGHEADGTPGDGSERKRRCSQRDVQVVERTLEPDTATKSSKRNKRNFEDDKASPAKGKELASSDHEEIGTSGAELLANDIQKIVDEINSKDRAGGAGDEVPLRACGTAAAVEPQPGLALICYENGSGRDYQFVEHSSSARADFSPEVDYTDPDDVHQQIVHGPDPALASGRKKTTRLDDVLEIVHVPATGPFRGRKKEKRQEYKVLHIYQGRNFGSGTEYLTELEGYSEREDRTELEGYSEREDRTYLDRDDDTGFWWVPCEQFGWDMMRCYIG
ncbi:hypothetical protein KC19_8G057400 [Ceratodon purpureus]|uniref:TF-B3 domain-containing protein n=1 Tax=Ceratodon purpureus TaxID=3225 RepID=A0A8T0H030_CERPU|nr:hypothetical protein KC19_8G057400 [Ceratodon purpureus]